jgi:hypothetical protein
VKIPNIKLSDTNNVKHILSFLSGASHEQLARSSKVTGIKKLMTPVI